MISHSNKAIFIHVPKNGGTSMNNYFRKHDFSGMNYHRAADGSNDDQTGAYKIGAARRLMRGLEEWSGYFKFGFVRNPWDRMVSCWKNRGGRFSGNFDDFVMNYPFDGESNNVIWHALPQSTHICDEDGVPLVDYIGRFEHMLEDMSIICDILNISFSESDFPHKNKTEHKHYTDYYNKKTRDKVFKDYFRDIELFNYDFDS